MLNFEDHNLETEPRNHHPEEVGIGLQEQEVVVCYQEVHWNVAQVDCLEDHEFDVGHVFVALEGVLQNLRYPDVVEDHELDSRIEVNFLHEDDEHEGQKVNLKALTRDPVVLLEQFGEEVHGPYALVEVEVLVAVEEENHELK